MKGGNNIGVRSVVGGSWGCSIFWKYIIHYYYCQSEGGEDSSQGGEDPPPLENTLRSSFIKILKKPKAIVQGFFLGVRKNMLKK